MIPPFGDNIFYSDFMNFFYVWLPLYLHESIPPNSMRQKRQVTGSPSSENAPTDESNDHIAQD